MSNKRESIKKTFNLIPKKNQRKKLILLKMRYGIDIFYELFRLISFPDYNAEVVELVDTLA